MMRRIMWIFAWISVGFWSLVSFVAHSVVDWVGWTGRATSREVPGFTPEPDSFAALVSLLHQTGLSAVVIGWALGVMAILAAALLLDHLVFRKRLA